MIENSGSLSRDGSPINPTVERKMVDGLKTVVISGTGDDPEAFRGEETLAPDGTLIEASSYQHDKLLDRHVQERDKTTTPTLSETPAYVNDTGFLGRMSG